LNFLLEKVQSLHLVIIKGKFMSISGLSRAYSKNIPEPARRAYRYIVLGVNFEKQGEYQKALQQHFLALKFFRQAYPPRSSNIISIHAKIADCYEKLGETQKAAEHKHHLKFL
jgi:tetratricopeptide (TPR) repeat protein